MHRGKPYRSGKKSMTNRERISLSDGIYLELGITSSNNDVRWWMMMKKRSRDRCNWLMGATVFFETEIKLDKSGEWCNKERPFPSFIHWVRTPRDIVPSRLFTRPAFVFATGNDVDPSIGHMWWTHPKNPSFILHLSVNREMNWKKKKKKDQTKRGQRRRWLHKKFALRACEGETVEVKPYRLLIFYATIGNLIECADIVQHSPVILEITKQRYNHASTISHLLDIHHLYLWWWFLFDWY